MPALGDVVHEVDQLPGGQLRHIWCQVLQHLQQQPLLQQPQAEQHGCGAGLAACRHPVPERTVCCQQLAHGRMLGEPALWHVATAAAVLAQAVHMGNSCCEPPRALILSKPLLNALQGAACLDSVLLAGCAVRARADGAGGVAGVRRLRGARAVGSSSYGICKESSSKPTDIEPRPRTNNSGGHATARAGALAPPSGRALQGPWERSELALRPMVIGRVMAADAADATALPSCASRVADEEARDLLQRDGAHAAQQPHRGALRWLCSNSRFPALCPAKNIAKRELSASRPATRAGGE